MRAKNSKNEKFRNPRNFSNNLPTRSTTTITRENEQVWTLCKLSIIRTVKEGKSVSKNTSNSKRNLSLRFQDFRPICWKSSTRTDTSTFQCSIICPKIKPDTQVNKKLKNVLRLNRQVSFFQENRWWLLAICQRKNSN